MVVVAAGVMEVNEAAGIVEAAGLLWVSVVVVAAGVMEVNEAAGVVEVDEVAEVDKSASCYTCNY